MIRSQSWELGNTEGRTLLPVESQESAGHPALLVLTHSVAEQRKEDCLGSKVPEVSVDLL